MYHLVLGHAARAGHAAAAPFVCVLRLDSGELEGVVNAREDGFSLHHLVEAPGLVQSALEQLARLHIHQPEIRRTRVDTKRLHQRVLEGWYGEFARTDECGECAHLIHSGHEYGIGSRHPTLQNQAGIIRHDKAGLDGRDEHCTLAELDRRSGGRRG